MSSRIEQLIDEIEDYIDNCKYQTLSKTNIIVNKEEIDELLRELRTKTPHEIKTYQTIISNKEAILNDARKKAEDLVNKAAIQLNQQVNEHEIMQQAYAQAGEVVKLAQAQAQDILNNATIQANEVRQSSMQYLDDMLANLENVMTTALSAASSGYDTFFTSVNSLNEIVKSNRAELQPVEVERLIQEVEGNNQTVMPNVNNTSPIEPINLTNVDEGVEVSPSQTDGLSLDIIGEK